MSTSPQVSDHSELSNFVTYGLETVKYHGVLKSTKGKEK